MSATDAEANIRLELRARCESSISRLAWVPKTGEIAAACQDGHHRLLQPLTGEWRTPPLSHERGRADEQPVALAMASSPDGRFLAYGEMRSLQVWEPATGFVWVHVKTYHPVIATAWSADGHTLAYAVDRRVFLRPVAGRSASELRLPQRALNITWSPDGTEIAAAFRSGVVIWNPRSNETRAFAHPGGNASDVAWSPVDDLVACGGDDGSISLWRPAEQASLISVLEGHTARVAALAFSPDGQLLASLSAHELILRRCDSWEHVWQDHGGSLGSGGIAFDAIGDRLCVRGPTSQELRVLRVDGAGLLADVVERESVRYAAAKIVLVGDAGVGKTGLGWRLAHGEFKEHPSTHGQQFWLLPSLASPTDAELLREAVLWDLAGQHDYRLIHSLFLDDADLALLVFDPTERPDPLKSVAFWVKALAARERPCPMILVAGRTDRGGLGTLTTADVEAFCHHSAISGGYVETSARGGSGLDTLVDRMREQVAWDQIAPTVTTVTFKRIKEFVLALKGEATVGSVLVETNELRGLLEAHDATWDFADAEMRTAVRHLARHGYVRILTTAEGNEVVLLRPELLNNLASSFILEAGRNPRGLGAVDEGLLLRGGYPFPELAPLSPRDAATLTEAVIALFIGHNICFRDTLGTQTLLIFPELINLRKPEGDSATTEQDTAYTAVGAVQNVYAALVVLLGYTNVFTRTEQWQDEARYEMRDGTVCGFRLLEEREGELELVLYYGVEVTESQKRLFQGLFETILASRDVTVTRYGPLVCRECQYRQDRLDVMRRSRQGREHLFCEACGHRIALPKVGKPVKLSTKDQAVIQDERLTALRKTAFEEALTRLKGYVSFLHGDAPSPTCFISYAWGVPDDERWVDQVLAKDLSRAGVTVILDRRDNAAAGSSIARFVERIEGSDWVLVIGTPSYLQKYENSTVAAEVDLILQRFETTEARKKTVIPALLRGEPESAFFPLLRGRTYIDFRRPEAYFAQLLELLLTLHRIHRDDKAALELRNQVAGL